MLKKISNMIDLSFSVTDNERNIATKAIETFNDAANLLDVFASKLHILIDAFESVDVFPEQVVQKKRTVINDYSKYLESVLDKLKAQAMSAIVDLNNFLPDQNISELIAAANDSVGSLEKSFLMLKDNLGDIKNENFKSGAIIGAKNLIKQISLTRDVITDRAIAHISNEILSKSWSDDVDEVSVNNDEPYIVQLYRQRSENVEQNAAPQITKGNQPLNPSDTARVWQPDKHKPWEPSSAPITVGDILP